MSTFVPSSGSLNAVVFDLGSLNSRAGFAGEELPRVVYASVAGQFSDATGAKYSVVEMDRLGWAQPNLEAWNPAPKLLLQLLSSCPHYCRRYANSTQRELGQTRP